MYERAPFSVTPWVLRLLAANGVVFFLTITVFTGPWFFEFSAFSPGSALQRPWSFVTYMFVHAGFMHIALNMLMLFFFGPAVEERLGGAAFLRYYFLCGLGGAVLSFAVALIWPVQPFVGASGAVFGVSLAFALYWPNAPIFIFPIPIPIKAKWLVLGLATISLASALFRASDGVAHLAHLGGFLAGVIYLKGGTLLERRGSPARGKLVRARVLVHPSAENAEANEHSSARTPRVSGLSDEVNRVLDKISATGLESLTPEEKKLLDEMSERLRSR
jgi:membrane associated rhomboid family serine protease